MLRCRGDDPPCLGSGEVEYRDALAENSNTAHQSPPDTRVSFLTNRTRALGMFLAFAYGESLLVPAGYAMAHKEKMISIHALQVQEC